jgi:hypothetical protein
VNALVPTGAKVVPNGPADAPNFSAVFPIAPRVFPNEPATFPNFPLADLIYNGLFPSNLCVIAAKGRKKRANFGLRWQSAAATPLFERLTPSKAAWRFASRRTPKLRPISGSQVHSSKLNTNTDHEP